MIEWTLTDGAVGSPARPSRIGDLGSSSSMLVGIDLRK